MDSYNKIPSKGSRVLGVFFIISILFGLGFAGGAHYIYYGSESMMPVVLGFIAGVCFPLIFTILVLWMISLTKAFGPPDGMAQ